MELRRLRLDLIFAYKLVFGLTDLNLNEFFKLRTDYGHRGHKYKLFLQAADPTPDITFSLTVQEEYGINCQLTILTFLI